MSGVDADRQLSRGALTPTCLTRLARHRPPREASCEQAVRHAEIRRLTLALNTAARELKANLAQLQAMVNDIAPGINAWEITAA